MQRQHLCKRAAGVRRQRPHLAAGGLQQRQHDERAEPPQQEEQVEQAECDAGVEQQEHAPQERRAPQRRPRELLVLPPPLRAADALAPGELPAPKTCGVQGCTLYRQRKPFPSASTQGLLPCSDIRTGFTAEHTCEEQ